MPDFKWADVVVGAYPCSKGFIPGTPDQFLHKKEHFLILVCTGNDNGRATVDQLQIAVWLIFVLFTCGDLKNKFKMRNWLLLLFTSNKAFSNLCYQLHRKDKHIVQKA